MKHQTIAVLAAMSLLSAGAGGALAYYSAQTATLQNEFSIVAGGTEDGDDAGGIEEVFNPSDAQDLSPRETFTKEAALRSNVNYDAYAYLCVTVPNSVVKTSADTDARLQEVLSLNFDSSKWQLVKKTAGTASAPSAYLYRLNSVLSGKATSPNLFTTVTIADLEESDRIEGSIDITGYLLSSEGVETSAADADAIAHFFP